MNVIRSVLISIGVALAAAGVIVSRSEAAPSSAPTIYATGLERPRGLAFGPDGNLYVAEAGTGGTLGTGKMCDQVPAPIGPYTGGMSARISKIDRKGVLTPVAAGFPSAVDAQGDLLGVADVAFLNGQLYALLAGGGCSHGNPNSPNGIAKVDTTSGKWKLIADLGGYVKAHPTRYESTDDFEPDGSFYGMRAIDGSLYAVEPNHGQVLKVTSEGKITQLIDLSASQGHVVPTSIAGRRGSFFLGNLNLFPIDPQWARIFIVKDPDAYDDDFASAFEVDHHGAHVVDSKAGFTTIVGVTFGPDDLLYVLELSAAPGYPTPGEGKVVRVKESGEIEDVVVGLAVPTGMTFGPDGALYVSNLGAVPAGAGPADSGQILRFEIMPVD